MFRKKRKINAKLRQVFWITIAWTSAGALDAFNTRALVVNMFPRHAGVDKFSFLLTLNILSGAFAGLIAGSLLVFILREWTRRRPFGFSILVNSLTVSTINFAITVAIYYLLIALQPVHGLLTAADDGETIAWTHSAFYLRSLFFWITVAVLTIILLNVNEKYGPGVFAKLLMGRYYRPREEERIFMFVDMKSSTAIAERLGNIRFFNLLNDFFRDLTDPISATGGEIYQYVGDEIVISWPIAKGAENANCIRCFFGMQEKINTLAWRYIERYGLIPEFKAGLHCGLVTVGEIGVIKKDIVFSGDVMNTAARIQAVCNKFRVKILFSRYLLDQLSLPPHSFTPKRMGIIELKGKRAKVELYTLEEGGPGIIV
jgi:adenylate cyclase